MILEVTWRMILKMTLQFETVAPMDAESFYRVSLLTWITFIEDEGVAEDSRSDVVDRRSK